MFGLIYINNTRYMFYFNSTLCLHHKMASEEYQSNSYLDGSQNIAKQSLRSSNYIHKLYFRKHEATNHSVSM